MPEEEEPSPEEPKEDESAPYRHKCRWDVGRGNGGR